MNYILSILTGFIISIMVALSGKLTQTVGIYHATFIAHFISIIILSLILFYKKTRIKINKKIPLYYFSGGFLGVLTTVFNNYAFSYIGVSILLSLCLFGQSLTSFLLDIFQVFNHKAKNNVRTYIGLLFLIIGIIIMIIY